VQNNHFIFQNPFWIAKVIIHTKFTFQAKRKTFHICKTIILDQLCDIASQSGNDSYEDLAKFDYYFSEYITCQLQALTKIGWDHLVLKAMQY
jgi:hypothetical protein